MSGFLHIKRIAITTRELGQVYSFLRQAGEKGVEGVGLFAGQETEEVEFSVTAGIVPAQKGYQLDTGLLYAVDGKELHRINVWLHENNLSLIGQIHTHPGEAYHSETDDRYPIVDTFGSISIVVPDFAVRPMRVEDWAVYRLLPKKGWIELSLAETNNLIHLV